MRQSSVLDEDDRDFKRTRKPTEEVEEKSISTSTRESHFGFKPKKRRAEHDHDGGLRNKVSRDDSIDGVPTEGKGKQATDGLRKKEGSDEYQVELERSDRPRESSSGTTLDENEEPVDMSF